MNNNHETDPQVSDALSTKRKSSGAELIKALPGGSLRPKRICNIFVKWEKGKERCQTTGPSSIPEKCNNR